MATPAADPKGTVADLATLRKDAANRPDNMDFIYLDVWYQDSWETRRIAEQINSLGWRFTTEFSDQGEYDSTWQHWATDATYGGAGMKGFNSEIIRFIRNDQRDSQVLNYPQFGGTA
ncbi:engBF, partial [gut metagenome]